MALAVEDKGGRTSLRFVDTGRGVSHDGAAPRRLPECFSILRIDGDDEAIAGARALFHEFCIVLFVAENHFVFVNDGRDATAMLANKRAEVALPNLLAVVVECREHVVIGLVPEAVNAFGINCTRR